MNFHSNSTSTVSSLATSVSAMSYCSDSLYVLVGAEHRISRLWPALWHCGIFNAVSVALSPTDVWSRQQVSENTHKSCFMCDVLFVKPAHWNKQIIYIKRSSERNRSCSVSTQTACRDSLSSNGHSTALEMTLLNGGSVTVYRVRRVRMRGAVSSVQHTHSYFAASLSRETHIP